MNSVALLWTFLERFACHLTYVHDYFGTDMIKFLIMYMLKNTVITTLLHSVLIERTLSLNFLLIATTHLKSFVSTFFHIDTQVENTISHRDE